MKFAEKIRAWHKARGLYGAALRSYVRAQPLSWLAWACDRMEEWLEQDWPPAVQQWINQFDRHLQDAYLEKGGSHAVHAADANATGERLRDGAHA